MYFQLQPKFWPWQWVWLINWQCIASLQSGGCALPAVTSHNLKVKIYFQLLQHGYIFILSQSAILEKKNPLSYLFVQVHISCITWSNSTLPPQWLMITLSGLEMVATNGNASKKCSYTLLYYASQKLGRKFAKHFYICNTVIYQYHITQPHCKCTLSWFSVTSNLCVT